MFHTEPMQKVRIICLSKDKDSVIIEMQRLGMIDLRKSRLNFSDDEPSALLDQLSELLIRVEGALNILKPRPITPRRQLDVKELIKRIERLSVIEEIYLLRNERKAIIDEKRLLNYAEYVAKSFSSIEMDFSKLQSSLIAVRGFEIGKKEFKNFEKTVGRRPLTEVVTSPSGKANFAMLIAYDRRQGMEDILKKYKLREFDLTSRYLAGTPAHVLSSVERTKSKNRERLASIHERLRKISDEYYSGLSNLKEMLGVEMERAKVSTMFKRTESTFVVEGWMPRRNVGEFTKAMGHVTNGRFCLEDLGKAEELAPTLVMRPRFLKSFDYMMEFLSIPRSDEIDPTWIFILSFPIFYGFMVADVGYGALSFLFATWIKRVTNPEGLVSNTASIWQIGAVSTVFFGILTNEYFGLQFNNYWLPSILPNFHALDWFKDVPTIAVISLFFGLVQIVLGLFLGFINMMHKHHTKIAISRLTSIVLLVSGTVAISGGLFNVFDAGTTMAYGGVAILSLLVTMALAGREAGEVPNLISHVLSYTRIMGFGLVGTIIAFLIDKAFTPSLSQGPLLFAVYLLVFIIFHFLNMIVSIFEGIVQAIRLNFVEFFTKFYEGGGIKFRPFSYKRVYTKE